MYFRLGLTATSHNNYWVFKTSLESENGRRKSEPVQNLAQEEEICNAAKHKKNIKKDLKNHHFF